MMIRFLLIAICIFPSFSIAGDTASCYQALTIWVDQKADMRTVIPALKIGADDGDEVCAAFLGEINPS
uniref:hypothetical protein n=1 Tax=Yoonia sp. TaxID=2212373 RepID=UPI00404891F4